MWNKRMDQKTVEELIGYFLPKDTLKYFEIEKIDVMEGKEKYMGKYGFDDEYTVVLKEREILPDHPQMYTEQKIRTKGYSSIVIEDFPIRGRKTNLKFRIRKWQAEGAPMIIQRKFEISHEGVKYSDEFAFFFEEGNRE
jgi:hypothetical protein